MLTMFDTHTLPHIYGYPVRGRLRRQVHADEARLAAFRRRHGCDAIVVDRFDTEEEAEAYMQSSD
jgi:hypothetical protein